MNVTFVVVKWSFPLKRVRGKDIFIRLNCFLATITCAIGSIACVFEWEWSLNHVCRYCLEAIQCVLFYRNKNQISTRLMRPPFFGGPELLKGVCTSHSVARGRPDLPEAIRGTLSICGRKTSGILTFRAAEIKVWFNRPIKIFQKILKSPQTR